MVPGATSPVPVWRRRGPVAVLAGLVVLACVAVASIWWLGRGPAGPYAEALQTLPEQTLRSSFTDWAQVADEVDVPDIEAAKDPQQVDDFLDSAYDADLVTGSTLLDVLPGLALTFGYSPAQVEWEAYGQARQGSVEVLRMSDDVDFDDVADNLERAGYDAPDDADGVWRGSGDLMVEFESPLTTLQINVLLLDDQRLIMTSDDAAYLESTRAVVEGEEPSLREVSGIDPLLAQVEGAVSAQLWSRDFACEDLAMSQADPIDREQGARLVEQAGGVHALDGLVMARTGGQEATIAMWFDSAADADADLQPRTDLARGAAPGQGGDFIERFTVEESRSEGRLITMRIRAEVPSLMSDLGQGPVLYAAC